MAKVDSFHTRFNITYGIENAQRNFINRADNYIFDCIVGTLHPADQQNLYRRIAFAVGASYSGLCLATQK